MLKTLIYALSNQPPQNPLAEMSEQAPSWILADVPASVSSVIGWVSSTDTSWHTNERRLAVTCQILLCLIVGKPPFWQERVWSTETLVPHAQWVGD